MMSLRTVLVLSVFLTVITVGSALKCYACAGSATSDCAKGRASSMVVQECPKIPNNSFSYVTHYYSGITEDEETDSNVEGLQEVCVRVYETDPKLFARGCGIFPSNVDPCEFIEQRMKVKGCKYCKTDLCNTRAEVEDPVVNLMV